MLYVQSDLYSSGVMLAGEGTDGELLSRCLSALLSMMEEGWDGSSSAPANKKQILLILITIAKRDDNVIVLSPIFYLFHTLVACVVMGLVTGGLG